MSQPALDSTDHNLSNEELYEEETNNHQVSDWITSHGVVLEEDEQVLDSKIQERLLGDDLSLSVEEENSFLQSTQFVVEDCKRQRRKTLQRNQNRKFVLNYQSPSKAGQFNENDDQLFGNFISSIQSAAAVNSFPIEDINWDEFKDDFTNSSLSECSSPSLVMTMFDRNRTNKIKSGASGASSSSADERRELFVTPSSPATISSFDQSAVNGLENSPVEISPTRGQKIDLGIVGWDDLFTYYTNCKTIQDFRTLYFENDEFLRKQYEVQQHGQILSKSSRGTIKMGSVEAFIVEITSPSDKSKLPPLIFSFILTYRGFTKAETILELLKMRYNYVPVMEVKNDDGSCHIKATESITDFTQNFGSFLMTQLIPIRTRICQLLQFWLSQHFYDFRNNHTLQDTLKEFIGEMIKTGMSLSGNILLGELNKSVKRRETFVEQLNDIDFTVHVDSPKSKTKYSKDNMKTMPLYDFKSVDIASQLTLIDILLFKRILPKELLNQNWLKEKQAQSAPNVYSMIQRFNMVAHYTVFQIVNKEDVKERASVIQKFIKIAQECRIMCNFNSMTAIISGLESKEVYRLSKTWTLIPTSLMSTFNELKEFASHKKNYSVFRQEIKTLLDTDKPFVPYLGIYLTDLTFIEDGNKDMVDGKINFTKRILLASVIKEIQQIQKNTDDYHLNDIPELRERLTTLSFIEQDELYKLSIKAEPLKEMKKKREKQ